MGVEGFLYRGNARVPADQAFGENTTAQILSPVASYTRDTIRSILYRGFMRDEVVFCIEELARLDECGKRRGEFTNEAGFVFRVGGGWKSGKVTADASGDPESPYRVDIIGDVEVEEGLEFLEKGQNIIFL